MIPRNSREETIWSVCNVSKYPEPAMVLKSTLWSDMNSIYDFIYIQR